VIGNGTKLFVALEQQKNILKSKKKNKRLQQAMNLNVEKQYYLNNIAFKSISSHILIACE
jgi:hypothetical protein